MSLDLQISTEIRQSEYDTWQAYAYVTTAGSRKAEFGKGRTSATDESIMLAVAFAVAARFLASSPHGFSAPSVGLNSAGTKAYVRIETAGGTKPDAQSALKVLDQSVKAFKLSDIGL